MVDNYRKTTYIPLVIVVFLTIMSLLVFPDMAKAASSDLFFSEYLEGSSNNKALEIYNGTGNAVNLASSEYSVKMFFNGSSTAGLTINLTGTIEAGDVYVLAHASANPVILAQADQINSASWFNGNDAVVLMKGTTVIDCIGRVGENSGTAWVGGGISTVDHTLIRKPEVTEGDIYTTDLFDPSLQWTSDPVDTFSHLGSHDISTFTVIFDLGAHGTLGTGQLSQTVYYGQSATAPTVIPDTAYNFTGWDTAFNNVTNNLTVTAQYEIKTFAVTFNSGTHGSFDPSDTSSVQIINYGQSAIEPTIIPDIEYNFTGWDIEFNNVTDNLTITAQYEIKAYTVTFKSGTHGSFDPFGASSVQIINYGYSAIAPTVIPDLAYNAISWDTDFRNITSDLTVTAQYKIRTYPELFFSEYLEGSSNNKALEIYNGTGNAVNLASSEYSVKMFFNGSSTAGLTINLTGTIAAGDVYVLAQSFANATILAQSDQVSPAGWFNGNDAVVLLKGTTVIDCIGRVGEDPGTEWGTGDITTLNHTLIRKPIVSEGDANTSDTFDPSLQWISKEENTSGFLGNHDISTYTVTFDLGAHGTLETGQLAQTVYYGQSVTAPTVIPDIAYNFTGWNTAADGSGTTYAAGSTFSFPEDTTLYAQWTVAPTLASSVTSGTIYVGGRITLTPNIDGGTWDWDEDFFTATFNSPATFTGLKAGASTITYTVEGVSVTYDVTIKQSQLPFTGQNYTLVYLLAAFALVTGGAAAMYSQKQRRRERAK